MKKTSIFILIVSLFLAAGFCFSNEWEAFAAEDEEENLSLKVYYDTISSQTCLESYDASALKAIAAAEGNREYTYSTFNTYPTARKIEKVTGPTVYGILNGALQGNTVAPEINSVDKINDEWVIEFRSVDQTREWFTKGQLFNEARYYYPNWNKEQDRCGQPVLPESMAGSLVEVPAVLSLTEKAGSEEAATHDDSDDVGRLLFGQTVPNEQNLSAFVKYMTTGGKIIIHPQNAARWNPVTGIKSGSTEVPIGGITLDRNVNPFHTGDTPRYWIFYTTDGSAPDNRSNMYNYNNFEFGGLYEGINKPMILAPGEKLTVKVKVWGYGRLDSEVTTLTFTGKELTTPELIRAEPFSADTIRLSWTKSDDVAGYKIYRSENSTGPFAYFRTVRGDDQLTFEDTTCEPGISYFYQVKAFTAYCNAGSKNEQTVEGDASNTKWAIASLDEDSMKAPSMIAAKRLSYNSIRIDWSKVDNVTGYQVYRSKGDANHFKLFKTIKGNSTVTYKDTTCLTGTKYYYKVRAFTPAFDESTESEYTLYSSFSKYKSAAASLTKPTIKSLVAGKKKATVKWGRITGASGYVVYRSTKQSSGYKAVKTIAKGGTVSFTNTKLKTGKRYYFKMRAYRTVSGKKVYSSYSAVKSVRVK